VSRFVFQSHSHYYTKYKLTTKLTKAKAKLKIFFYKTHHILERHSHSTKWRHMTSLYMYMHDEFIFILYTR